MAPSTGLVSAWGETDVCTNRYHEHPYASNLGCMRRDTGDVWRLAVQRNSSADASLEELANAGAAVRCSSSTRAVPRI